MGLNILCRSQSTWLASVSPYSTTHGIALLLHVLERNPRYFPEPEEYKPSRWYGLSSDSELFSAFSIGARACIGRKFATVEAVALLAVLLRDWKVELLLKEGETNEAWRYRVLDAKFAMTLGVKDVPLKFSRRGKE